MEMSLSQAMRLGAMARPQAMNAYLTSDGRTCAIGAAMDADGIEHHHFTLQVLYDRWPVLLQLVEHPILAGGDCYVEEIIYDLNDNEKWSREQIAAWLETIERAQDAARVPEHLAVAD